MAIYVIWDTVQNKITKGPFYNDPKRIQWSSGDTTSPMSPGMTNQNEVYAVFVDTKNIPRWSEINSLVDTFNGTDTVTRTYTYVRSSGPTREDVINEGRQRILNAGEAFDYIEAAMDWIALKEAKDTNGSLTAAQQTRWNEISAMRQYYKDVKTAAKGILALTPIPDDYDSDSRWP